jgi:hypothetical protein
MLVGCALAGGGLVSDIVRRELGPRQARVLPADPTAGG